MDEQNVVQRAVDQLKADGYVVRFTHWRIPEGGTESVRYSRKDGWLTNDPEYGTDWKYGLPYSNGGATVCCIGAHDGGCNVINGTQCRSTEPFCYAQGRRYSLVRAIREVEQKRSLSKDIYEPIKGALCGKIKEFDPSIREKGIVW